MIDNHDSASYAETLPASVYDPDKPRIYRLGDLLDEWDSFAEEAYAAKQGNRPLGVKTGLQKVDEAIGGMFQPGLHSLQGGPGIGKTAFALQIAASCGFPALYVSCEMAPMELMRRITSRVTGTFLNKFKTGELDPETAKSAVRRAITTCPNLAILDSTRGYVPAFATDGHDMLNMYDLAQTLRGDSPYIFIIVDSLHSWADKALVELKEYEYLNTAIGSLRGLAGALNCPILTITERNRASMEKGGLSGGAGTRKIEYSAESVIELDAEPDTKPDANGEMAVSLKLSKNRNGIIGRPVELRFNGALQRYREV